MRCLVLTENIDVIAVNKTRINAANNDLIYEYNIDEYNKYRFSRRGGGVGSYISTWLNPIEISLNDSNIEHVCVTGPGETAADHISITYRPSAQTQELDKEI